MPGDESRRYQRPVLEGVFIYDRTVEMPMYVIEQNYDYFHSMYESEGVAEPDEKPVLNDDGLVYYYFFGELPSSPPYGVSGIHASMSLAEARSWAETNLSYFGRWLSWLSPGS